MRSRFEKKHITTIQSFWRSFHTQKKYSIAQTSTNDLKDYNTFLIGNDPKIKNIKQFKPTCGKIALIGTSGLRSLGLICKLGNQEKTPKLIIIDNSHQVIVFWRKLKQLVCNNRFEEPGEFYEEFEIFLLENIDLYRNFHDDALMYLNTKGVVYENQNPRIYIRDLVEKYGLNYVVNIIKHCSIIAQSWADENTFYPLKNILDLIGIDKLFLYPSNIAHCLGRKNARPLLHNLEILSPDLSIVTDLCLLRLRPKNVMFLTENKAESLEKEIFGDEDSFDDESTIRVIKLN